MIEDELMAHAQKLGGTVLAFALGVLAFWAKAQRTKSDGEDSKARADILVTAILERDKMAEKFNEALSELRTLAEDNSRLRTENANLLMNQIRMQAEIDKLRENQTMLQQFIRKHFPDMPDEAFSTMPAPLS